MENPDAVKHWDFFVYGGFSCEQDEGGESCVGGLCKRKRGVQRR